MDRRIDSRIHSDDTEFRELTVISKCGSLGEAGVEPAPRARERNVGTLQAYRLLPPLRQLAL